MNITDPSGFIVSPGYPSFTAVEQECVLTIIVPDDKIINIWIPALKIKDSESNNEYILISIFLYFHLNEIIEYFVI
jgi:hypothetical protein